MANEELPASDLTGIAHDVSNMLSAISGFADLLAEDLEQAELPDRSALRENVANIQEAVEKAMALTATLLASSHRHEPE